MPYFNEAPPAPAVQPVTDVREFVQRYRHSVPAVRKFVYMNHASVGPLSDWVVAAVNEQLVQQQMGETIVQDGWFDGWRLVRQRVAELLSAEKRQVCLHSSTYEGLVRAFNALPVGAGDEALCPADEFPSVWHSMTELSSRGAEVRGVASGRGDGIVRTADVLDAITPRTRVICVSWVNFFHGYRHDLAALGAACRQRGIWLAVDAIQGLGGLALDAPATGAHFISGQGAKWLSAPLGSGYLYVSDDVPPEITPRTQGWFAMELNHDSYTDRTVRAKLNANRFAMGTVPFPSAYGMRRACEVFLEAGPQRAQDLALSCADRIDAAAWQAGLPVFSDRRDELGELASHRSPIISLRVDRAPQLAAELRAAGVVFSVREGLLRLSPHWYNTEAEVEQVCALIQRCTDAVPTTA